MSARSSDNKGTAVVDLPPGTASYLSFTLAPNAGESLDFTGSTVDFDATLYNDASVTFDMAYRVFANTGSGFSALDPKQTVSLNSSGTEDRMFEVDGTTDMSPGWALTAGTVGSATSALSFDISSLAGLGTDQSVIFAISLSGTRDNHGGFGSSVDNIGVTANTVRHGCVTLSVVAAWPRIFRPHAL